MRRILFALLALSLLADSLCAEDPVHFPDANLKAAVEDTLWITDPTPSDMLGLTELTCIGSPLRENAIVSLAGLQYALNLQSLTLRTHRINNISPLSGLSNLQTLLLDDNEIDDISPLSGLVNLWTLNLMRNDVSDISALSGMTQLGTLSLHRNRVSDISPLAGLTSLRDFDLRINPLDQEAYDTYIPQIIANNPGIWFAYDPYFHRRIIIDCGVGGRITSPREGAQSFEYGTYIWLIAEPDPGFVFAGWTGTYSTTLNPIYFLVDQDYTLRANFASVLSTLYVDDNAPNDPGPGNMLLSDPQENGTPEHPFDSIQQAINLAGKKTSIIVRSGAYRENIELLGKNIQVTGIDPNDPNIAAYPVIEGMSAGPIVRFTERENASCRFTGFVITRGSGSPAAIECSGSSPTIANCLIVGNRSTGSNGAIIHCANSAATFVNCTIADNYVGSGGAAIVTTNSRIVLANSILWGNTPNQILASGDGAPSITGTNIQGGWPSSPDAGNIDADPLFAQNGYWADKNNRLLKAEPENMQAVWIHGDYHLKSQAGRWDPQTQDWVQDEMTSPCIDAGRRTDPVGQEPAPNGGIINAGAYGGTAGASKSVLLDVSR